MSQISYLISGSFAYKSKLFFKFLHILPPLLPVFLTTPAFNIGIPSVLFPIRLLAQNATDLARVDWLVDLMHRLKMVFLELATLCLICSGSLFHRRLFPSWFFWLRVHPLESLRIGKQGHPSGLFEVFIFWVVVTGTWELFFGCFKFFWDGIGSTEYRRLPFLLFGLLVFFNHFNEGVSFF